MSVSTMPHGASASSESAVRRTAAGESGAALLLAELIAAGAAPGQAPGAAHRSIATRARRCSPRRADRSGRYLRSRPDLRPGGRDRNEMT